MPLNGWVATIETLHARAGDRSGEKTLIHSWIDGGYLKKTGGIKVEAIAGKIHSAERIAGFGTPEGTFKTVVAYLVEQKICSTLYRRWRNRLSHRRRPRNGMTMPPFSNGSISCQLLALSSASEAPVSPISRSLDKFVLLNQIATTVLNVPSGVPKPENPFGGMDFSRHRFHF